MTTYYRCKIKSRKQLEKDIPRERWGWWIDVCPGKKLELRKATPEDLKRCGITDNRTHEDFMCEAIHHGFFKHEKGSLVSKEAIEHVEMSVDEI